MLHEISSIIANVIEATELDKIETEATTPEAIETNAAQEATTDANAEPIEEEAPEEIEEEDDVDDFDPANSERVKDAREEEDEETAEDVAKLVEMLGAEEVDNLDDDQIVACLALLRGDYSADSIEKYAIRYGDVYLYDGAEEWEEVAKRMAEEMGTEEEIQRIVGECYFRNYVTIDYERMGRDMSYEYSGEYISYKGFSGMVVWSGF